ncbi:hypothetical protein GPECTOR_31g348 [Gonium pectorale]|uniref:Uncharacterized protein n=1 Tax=Gonium pectorale TaxID=33097 RepID=A0A150GDT2_GONPE|nr:hypothetical protein GPECTOR_31g348 [Gonium pectorale]|eukprot:KXZ47986.1 hypothetical protein GPECTOR_31g348 [Gonium pectorale]
MQAVEMNVTMLLFALGLMMWIARFGVEEICVFGLTKAFGFASFLSDICVDLGAFGINTPDNVPSRLCGDELAALCATWSDLQIDYLSFGALLLLGAHSMFLGGVGWAGVG